MATSNTTTKPTTRKRGDIESKGKSKNRRKAKRTSIGASRNSHPRNKSAARERKGRRS